MKVWGCGEISAEVGLNAPYLSKPPVLFPFQKILIPEKPKRACAQ